MSIRGLSALLAVIVSCAMPHGLAAETLKIASPIRGSWEGAIPELGKQAGIFRKYGLDLDILYTQGGGETLQVVMSGSVDISLSAGALGSLGAYGKGAPLRIIGASSTGSRETFWWVAAKSPLRSMREVDGQSIAYSTTGASRCCGSSANTASGPERWRPETSQAPSPRSCPVRWTSAGWWCRSCSASSPTERPA